MAKARGLARIKVGGNVETLRPGGTRLLPTSNGMGGESLRQRDYDSKKAVRYL